VPQFRYSRYNRLSRHHSIHAWPAQTRRRAARRRAARRQEPGALLIEAMSARYPARGIGPSLLCALVCAAGFARITLVSRGDELWVRRPRAPLLRPACLFARACPAFAIVRSASHRGARDASWHFHADGGRPSRPVRRESPPPRSTPTRNEETQNMHTRQEYSTRDGPQLVTPSVVGIQLCKSPSSDSRRGRACLIASGRVATKASTVCTMES
jgi:hypothetical protein